MWVPTDDPFFLSKLRRFGGLKLAYIVWILQTLMADGREDDGYLVPSLVLRLADFVKDHGTPAENWAKVRACMQSLKD